MILHLLNAVKDVSSQPFIADSSVVPLDIGVLLRLPRLDVAERYVVLAGPFNEFATYKSRYVSAQTRLMGLSKNTTAYGIAAIAPNVRKRPSF